jgi:hypothetical protein
MEIISNDITEVESVLQINVTMPENFQQFSDSFSVTNCME